MFDLILVLGLLTEKHIKKKKSWEWGLFSMQHSFAEAKLPNPHTCHSHLAHLLLVRNALPHLGLYTSPRKKPTHLDSKELDEANCTISYHSRAPSCNQHPHCNSNPLLGESKSHNSNRLHASPAGTQV